MPSATLPSDVKDLRERLQKDQAPSAQSRTNYFDLAALRGQIGSHPFSSRRISINQCYEMRTDAVFQLALLVAMSSLLGGSWKIECRNARKAAFLDKALRQIYGRLILQFAGALEFGFQGLAKEFVRVNPSWEYIERDEKTGEWVTKRVWDRGDVPALIWDAFVPLKPEIVEPMYEESTGSFKGIKLNNASGIFPIQGVFPITNPADNTPTKDSMVDLDHSLWVVNERDRHWGSSWGYPRLGYGFKYWWAYEMTLGVLNRATESKGDPTVVVSYPIGTSKVDGEDKDNQEIAFEIADMARSGSVLVLPSEVWGDDDKGTGASKWKIDYLKTETDFDALRQTLSYLDTMKFRSMMTSELAVAEGSGGTSSRNVAAATAERTAEAQFGLQLEHDDIINRYMIPQLSDANFWEPEIRDEPARKVTKSFGEGEVELLKTMLESFANANSDKVPADWEEIMGILGVPVKDAQSIAEARNALVAKAETETAPEPAEAKANGNAGVTDTGFYYDSRDLISLAEDESFLAALPPTKHFDDRAVVAQTRLIRKLWFELLADQYEDFSKHLENSVDLSLRAADDKSVKERVKQIVDGWRYTAKTYQQVVKRTAAALSAIFSRAGVLEMKRANLKTDDWNPDEKELAQWVRDNAGMLVRNIDQTTRKQLNTFLYQQVKADKNAKEIALALREHFSEFPTWRADLIARESVNRFYNAATLFAANSAGKQVQALDARLGPTDHPCEERNGKLFGIDAAWAEEAKEHVRGTLAWRIVASKAELSVERVPSEEAGDWAARIDRDTNTILLREDLDSEAESRYLIAAVDWFENVPAGA